MHMILKHALNFSNLSAVVLLENDAKQSKPSNVTCQNQLWNLRRRIGHFIRSRFEQTFEDSRTYQRRNHINETKVNKTSKIQKDFIL